MATENPADKIQQQKDMLNQHKKDVEDNSKELKKQKSEIDKTLNEINKKMEETFKFACVLRLDMIADKLDWINQPHLADQIDKIADELEKNGEWENA